MMWNPATDGMLSSREACVRAVIALKAGQPPLGGIRYLSVGMEAIAGRLDEQFAVLEAGRVTAPVVARGDYGEGKSHLLRLIGEEAAARGFAWVVVTHDRQQEIGLHKPARLFRAILWNLRWRYPSLDWDPWQRFFDWYDGYPEERYFRSELPFKLRELASDLHSQGVPGLVVCIDELENYMLLAPKQKPVFRDVLRGVTYMRVPRVLVVFGATYSPGLPELEGRVLHAPPLDQDLAWELAERLRSLHARAFEWEPPAERFPNLVEYTWTQVRRVPSGRWRAFVQIVITLLERQHQALVTTAPRTARAEPRPVGVQPSTPSGEKRLVADAPPVRYSIPLTTGDKPKKPRRVEVGDRVEVVHGPLTGLVGRIHSIVGEKVDLVIETRMKKIRVTVALSQVRPARR